MNIPLTSAGITQDEVDIPPGIDLMFNIGWHTAAPDLAPLVEIKPKLIAAQMFFPEFTGWTPQLLMLLQRTSAGDPKASVQLQRWMGATQAAGFNQALVRALFKTKVHVALADLEANHPLLREFESAQATYPKLCTMDGPEAAIAAYRQHLVLLQAAIKARHASFVRRLGKELREAIQTVPKLMTMSQWQRLQVEVVAGSMHRLLFNALESLGAKKATGPQDPFTATVRYADGSYTEGLTHQAVAKAMQDKPMSDEFLARCLVEGALRERQRINPEVSTSNREAALAKLVGPLSDEDCWQLLRQLVDGRGISKQDLLQMT